MDSASLLFGLVPWGAVAAGCVALLAASWPLNLGLLAAIAAGTTVGLGIAQLDRARA